MSRPPRIQAQLLMFDLDGTLVNSLQDIATSINLTRADFALPTLPPGDIIREVGDGAAALVRRMVPVPPAQGAAALAALTRHYEAHLLDTTHLMPGVLPVLERFADRTLAVVTNKLHAQSERVLTALGIRRYFRLVVGGDSLAGRKPDPAPLLHVLQALHVAPAAAVMVGDGVNDVKAAKAARLPAVAVAGGVNSREELLALGPEAFIDTLDELPTVIA